MKLHSIGPIIRVRRHICAFAFTSVFLTIQAMADSSTIAPLTKADAQKILQAGWQQAKDFTIAAVIEGADLKSGKYGTCVATVIGTCGYPMQPRPNAPVVYTVKTFHEVLFYDRDLGWFLLSSGDTFDYDAHSKELAITTTAGTKVFRASPHKP